MTCWSRFQGSRLMPLAASCWAAWAWGTGNAFTAPDFQRDMPRRSRRGMLWGTGVALNDVGLYPTRPPTIVEHPTKSRDIHKSIWRPPPHGMGLGVAVINAIGSMHLGAAQSAAAAQQYEFAAFTMVRRLLDSGMGREADAHRFHVGGSICGTRAHRGYVRNGMMASCEAFPLGERSKHGGQIAHIAATCGPLDPENDRGKAKLIAVLSCLTSAANLLRAGSMHNKSAILMLADALEACWEIKKGSEAIQPAA
jgi:hypothetical protein